MQLLNLPKLTLTVSCVCGKEGRLGAITPRGERKPNRFTASLPNTWRLLYAVHSCASQALT